MNASERLLRVAEGEIGIRETPPGSNNGDRIRQYLRTTGLGGGYPWCAAFVAWCGDQAFGQNWPLPRTAGCDLLLAFARRHGVLRDTPQPGDVFLCLVGEDDATHTGLVRAVIPDGRAIATIEGNSNPGGSAEGYEVAARPQRLIDPPGRRSVRFIRWQEMLPAEAPWTLYLNETPLGAAEMLAGVNFYPARDLAQRLFGPEETRRKLGWDPDARAVTWAGEPLPAVATLRPDGRAWCPVRDLARSFGLKLEVDAGRHRVTLRRAR